MCRVLFMVRAVLPIQKTIQVTNPTATMRERAAEDLLGLEAQAVRTPGEQRADAERHDERDADAEPQLARARPCGRP